MPDAHLVQQNENGKFYITIKQQSTSTTTTKTNIHFKIYNTYERVLKPLRRSFAVNNNWCVCVCVVYTYLGPLATSTVTAIISNVAATIYRCRRHRALISTLLHAAYVIFAHMLTHFVSYIVLFACSFSCLFFGFLIIFFYRWKSVVCVNGLNRCTMIHKNKSNGFF